MAFSRRETAVLLLGDFVMLCISLYVALALRNLDIPSFSYYLDNLVPFIPIICLSLAVFYIAGLYEKQTRPIRRVMGARILGAQLANVVIAAIMFFALPLSIAPKTILALYLGVSVVAASLWRFRRMQRVVRFEDRVSALLIGDSESVRDLHDEINNNAQYLLYFTQWIRPGETQDLEGAVRAIVEKGVRVIVADTNDERVRAHMHFLYSHISSGVRVREFEALYEEILDRVPLHYLEEHRYLNGSAESRFIYDSAKRTFDIVLAIVGGAMALPFVAVASLLVMSDGRSPFIYSERIGKNGKHFHIVKIRTMLFNDQGDPELRAKNRVTRLGRILRRTRIDELPQLYNVLKGDLSFIGPRPELPNLAKVYEEHIPQYHMRYLLTPGLSGWAQIHDYDVPRGFVDIPKTERKLSFDLYYLKHRSFTLDLAIAIKTVRAVIALSGT